MSTTYTKEQQIYSLSFSANSAFGLSWKQEDCKSGMAAMQSYVTQVSKDVLSKTSSIIGNWKPVWGPIVYANDPTSNSVHADNTMGLYYNADENQFVIAIAGTNGNSPFGWFTEDFSVHTMVTWESITGVSNSGSIANGTSIGLTILKDKMKNASGETIATALTNFLASGTVPNGANIAVAGHSLGGALAPTLAMYLLNTKTTWDPKGITSITAYPTAGPTPGDKNFAKYYEEEISKKNITYISQHNSIDIVPHAWQETDLEQIPSIYDANIVPPSGENPSDAFMGILTSVAALNALSASFLKVPYNPYQQITPSTTLSGTFDTSVDDLVSKKLKYLSLVIPKNLEKYVASLKNVARFLAQAATQHTTAYYPLLGVTEFMDAYKIILEDDKPTGMTTEEVYTTVIKDTLHIDLNTIDTDAMENAHESKVEN